MQFVTKEEWDTFKNSAQDVNDINEILTRVHNKATEDAIRQMPSVLSRLFVSIQAQKKAIEDFYEKYPEFKDYKHIVGKVFEDIENKNPDKSLSDLVEQAVPIIRTHIMAEAKSKKMPLGMPANINLNGKGVL